MTRASERLIGTALLILALSGSVSAFTEKEHASVAREAVEIVAPECDGIVPGPDEIIYDGKTFSELCASWADDDRSFARYHHRGLSILQQLEELGATELQRNFDIAVSYGSKVADLKDRSANVIVNYLINHYVALRGAQLAAESPIRDRAIIGRVLAYEARAQGYLVDAFSSAHMLIPSSGILNGVLTCNIGYVHDYFRSEGLYVINSQGDGWRTFGDGLMDYYPPTHDPILAACCASLREVCLIYSVGQNAVPKTLADWGERVLGEDYQTKVVDWTPCRDGGYYYETARLPALMMLPMPVGAAWSVRSEERDRGGLAKRDYYPQLSDSGRHDPSLEKDVLRKLYSSAAVGSWMHLDKLDNSSAVDLVTQDPDVASVRFVQRYAIPPAYHGLITTYGLTGIVNDRGNGWGASFGIGYGIGDDLLVMQNPSIEVRVAPGFDESERFLVMLDAGASFDLDMLSLLLFDHHMPNVIRHLRGDLAYVRAVRSAFESSGARAMVGFELPSIRMPFAYVGLTTRVGYQLVALERTLHGPTIEIVLH